MRSPLADRASIAARTSPISLTHGWYAHVSLLRSGDP
jgi:hypothetical protein